VRSGGGYAQRVCTKVGPISLPWEAGENSQTILAMGLRFPVLATKFFTHWIEKAGMDGRTGREAARAMGRVGPKSETPDVGPAAVRAPGNFFALQRGAGKDGGG